MRMRARWFVLVGLVLALVAGLQSSFGAGFGIYEGSARGNALGGAMAGRADDPSAVYYNPAGITQLDGMQVMGGATLIRPSTTVKTMTPLGEVSTETEDNNWIPPHLYGTIQTSDKVWVGAGLFSRFGLGTEFPSDWPGRYNSYEAQIQTLTFNPDVALKVCDKLSVAAGVSATWFDLTLKQKLPTPDPATDIDAEMSGDAMGYGFNLGARYEIVKWLALGASYQSEVKEDVDGNLDLHMPGAETDASGDVTLPDMTFLGVFVKPMDKLSFEVGAIRTGWSSYDELKISLDNPAILGTDEISTRKDWENVWRYTFGVEYKLNEKLDLRAGYVYDEEAIPGDTADYLVPANDRQLYSVGCGYHVKNWALDLSYTYLTIRDRTVDARLEDGVLPSEFTDGETHMFGVSFSAKM